MTKQIKKLVSAIRANADRVILITHKNCNDGQGSRLALAHSLDVKPSSLETLYVQYNQYDFDEIATTCEGRHVVMADFCFTRNELVTLNRVTKTFLVIDHHETALEPTRGLYYCVFNMAESGASLTWKVFNHGVPIPAILRYIKDRDLWQWALPGSKLINEVLWGKLQGPNTDTEMDALDIHNTDGLITEGVRAVDAYKLEEIRKILKKTPKVVSLGVVGNIAVLNNVQYLSEVGEALSLTHAASASYVINNEGLMIVSMRSNASNPNHVHVGFLCKRFGGGGHRHAGGFSVSVNDPIAFKLMGVKS